MLSLERNKSSNILRCSLLLQISEENARPTREILLYILKGKDQIQCKSKNQMQILGITNLGMKVR